MATILPPNYAYVPGQNARHPEDTFDAIKETVIDGCDVEELAHCDAFCAGLQFLSEGYYWEAHEVLEPVWMALPEKSEERLFVQGLIQLANGRLKLLMQRPKAAFRLAGLARKLLPSKETRTIMTLDVLEIHQWIDELEAEAKESN